MKVRVVSAWVQHGHANSTPSGGGRHVEIPEEPSQDDLIMALQSLEIHFGVDQCESVSMHKGLDGWLLVCAMDSEVGAANQGVSVNCFVYAFIKEA